MNGRVTITDVAREAGVSKSLASFALNGRDGVAAETRARILEVARRMNYHGDPFARALRSGQTNSYGMVVRNMRNGYFLDVLEGAEEESSAHGASVLVLNSNFSREREVEQVRRLIRQRVGGLAITPVGDGPGLELWRELFPGLPLVVVNSLRGFGDDVSYVSPDNESAVKQAVDHLVERGHRRITFITPPEDFGMDQERLDVFVARCMQRGVTPEPFHAALRFEVVEREFGHALVSSAPPTAVITNSDYTAQAVYRAARETGVRVGVELSVVGHDDLPTSELLDPPLTTLRFDRNAIGRQVVTRLMSGESLENHVEPVQLVPRRSVATFRSRLH